MAVSAVQITSTNPADPADVIGVFAPSGGIDVDRAVTAAADGAPAWAGAPGQARADALSRVAARIEARADELSVLVCREVGKPIVEARGEVGRTAAIVRYHAQAALDPDGETYPPGDGRSLLMSRRRPRGVVGLITPWNFPLAIPAWKLAPALAYGNACVWKASPLAPASAEALMACLEPELRAGLVQLVQGGVDAGVALAGHAGLGAISFTGSAAAGASVARQAADRGLPAQCEMGGQNASIVLADADLGRAAAIIARAAMGYAGQKCTATSRVIAERGVAADLRDALVAEVEALVVENPADAACEVGPLITGEARSAAVAAVERAVADRAAACWPAEPRSRAPATTWPRRSSRSPTRAPSWPRRRCSRRSPPFSRPVTPRTPSSSRTGSGTGSRRRSSRAISTACSTWPAGWTRASFA